jgi:hypothetical protein
VVYIKTLEINSQKFDLNKDYEEGFLKGSAWNNLYSFYKFEPKEIKFNNDLDKLLYLYQIYSFISLELTLFISTHPNEVDAINMLNEVNKYLELIKMKLEENKIRITHCTTDSVEYFNQKTPWSGN